MLAAVMVGIGRRGAVGERARGCLGKQREDLARVSVEPG